MPEWIKVEKQTIDKLEIDGLNAILGISNEHAFGLCFRFWSWCDSNLTDRFLTHQTAASIDKRVGHSGFTAAMINVGWIIDAEGLLSVPNFERHMSQCAKRRGEDAVRKSIYRKNSAVPKMSQNKRDNSVTTNGQT